MLFPIWFISSLNNLSEKNFSLPGNRSGVFLLPRQALYQQGYGNNDAN